MSLNSRELAIVIWLVIGFAAILLHGGLRASVLGVLRSLVHPKILTPLIAMIGYVALLTRVGQAANLWDSDLIKQTVVWFLGSALVLFFKLNDATEQKGFFWRAALRTLQVTILLEFFLNLFVLNLVAELILQPILVLLFLLSAVSERDPKYRSVKVLTDWLLVIPGFSLAGFSLVQLVKQWDVVDKAQSLLELALPAWCTLGLLPFIYVLSIYVAYDGAFARINFMVKQPWARWKVKIALLLAHHWHVRRVVRLSRGPWAWAREAATAGSIWRTRRVIGNLTPKEGSSTSVGTEGALEDLDE